MGSGFSKMKKQARLMQEQLSEMKNKMESLEAEGRAGNGLVSLTLTGEKRLKKISIQPDCIDPNDPEGLQDLILAAFEEAFKKIESQSPSGGLPGFISPFQG